MAQTWIEQHGSPEREGLLRDWFRDWLARRTTDADPVRFSPVSGDASFRRYFRAQTAAGSFILVDAPPDKEDSRPFLAIAAAMLECGVRVPEVYHADPRRGFLCLSDLGDTLLWEKLERARRGDDDAGADATSLYRPALRELVKIQCCPTDGSYRFPPFSQSLLLEEMELFRHWFCRQLLGLEIGKRDDEILDRAFSDLADAALGQQQCCVHRDYHSRNLMWLGPDEIGVVDFQDAVAGPWTYDLVSLLKDCYIAWPRRQVESWALEYAELAREAGVVASIDRAAFLDDFDRMGVQRHLKATGIFARLYLRDGKPRYLQDIPRTLEYVRDAAARLPRCEAFCEWLERRVVPGVAAALAAVAEREQ